MRLVTATVTAAVGALLVGIPAAAANASAPRALTAAPCGSSSGFQRVMPGQSVAQVDQEMGSVGKTILDNHQSGHENLAISWRDCNALGLLSFVVDFNANPGQPATVDSKSVNPTVPSR